MATDRVQLYDTTLRDGSQMEGISLSVEDKIRITRKIDELGIEWIEGGFPGSNPKDAEYFRRLRTVELKNARVSAFGGTRKPFSTCAGSMPRRRSISSIWVRFSRTYAKSSIKIPFASLRVRDPSLSSGFRQAAPAFAHASLRLKVKHQSEYFTKILNLLSLFQISVISIDQW